ncbi:MAG TPA: peptide chain release factor 3 [Anaerolineales bacterium]|nr:peptide chain release factor 3 [Anaerolineales bacterium]
METPVLEPSLTANHTLEQAIAVRRTFAIISHPDAGKTTLTEKLLLYGNAIELAGNVRAKKNLRSTTSDWMAIERERGISISSTILQFPYQGFVLNLLDTPGHQDFSEDTYRTLSAADSAVMILDAAKGIEPQTLKLFEVCRKRSIPIFTFINKMDRPAREPLELLDEIESTLGMEAVPVNWPMGDGPQFRGVYDRRAAGFYLFERTTRNEKMAPEVFIPLSQVQTVNPLLDGGYRAIGEDLHLLDELGISFDPARVLKMEQTPVYFGSALTNFGVRMFLDDFVKFAPHPQPYPSETGIISPSRPSFSGFIFKIQANLNPRHRDSVAFLRVCSGRFERGITAIHAQTGNPIRLMRPYKLFANEREIVDRAFPGDIVGIPNNGSLGIGDTLYAGEEVRFAPMPRFRPEQFAILKNDDLSKHKQFTKGLQQLEKEGGVQVFFDMNALKREPIIGVVGQLQFDVLQARLQSEYKVSTTLERLPHLFVRWIDGPEEEMNRVPARPEVIFARDSQNRRAAIFSAPFYLRYYADHYPNLVFKETG